MITSTPLQALDRRTGQRIDSAGIEVRRRKGHILKIHFPAHAFDVNMDGYGFVTARVDPGVDIGTEARPKIWENNDCYLVKDPLSGQWHVTELVYTNTCTVTPTVPAPFTPLAASALPIDSQALDRVSLPDWTYQPTVISAGQVVPNNKMPPGGGGMPSCTPGVPGTILIWDGAQWNCWDLCTAIAACASCIPTVSTSTLTTTLTTALELYEGHPIVMVSGVAYMLWGQEVVAGNERIALVIVSSYFTPSTATIQSTTLYDTGSTPGFIEVASGIDYNTNIGNRIYFCAIAANVNLDKVYSIDVTNPAAPVLSGTLTVPFGGSDGLIVYGTVGYYVTVGDGSVTGIGTAGISIVDAETNPAVPVLVASKADTQGPRACFFDGNIVLYTNDPNGHIKAWQILVTPFGNAMTPTLLGSLTVLPAAGYLTIQMYFSGPNQYLYTFVGDGLGNRFIEVFSVDGAGGITFLANTGIANVYDYRIIGSHLYTILGHSIQCYSLAGPLGSPTHPHALGSGGFTGGGLGSFDGWGNDGTTFVFGSSNQKVAFGGG